MIDSRSKPYRNADDIIRKYQQNQQDQRVSMIKATQSEMNSPSILTLTQTEISMSENSFQQFLFDASSAYEQLKLLKDGVLTLLVNYQKALANENEDFRKLKGKLNQDAQEINDSYRKVIEQMKQFEVSPGNDTLLVMNVIEQFVQKFSGLKENQLYVYKQIEKPLIQEMRSQVKEVSVVQPKQENKVLMKEQPKQLELELSTFLQISNISNINFTLQEDTFYRANSDFQIQQRLQGKIERLKIVTILQQIIQIQRLEKCLSKQQLENTRQILKDSIDDLNKILSNNDLKDIKRIVYKMEQSISKLNESNVQGEVTIGLYQLLQKAIKFSRKKEKLQLQKIDEKQESQVSSVSAQLPPNAFIKKSIGITLPQDTFYQNQQEQKRTPLECYNYPTQFVPTSINNDYQRNSTYSSNQDLQQPSRQPVKLFQNGKPNVIVLQQSANQKFQQQNERLQNIQQANPIPITQKKENECKDNTKAIQNVIQKPSQTTQTQFLHQCLRLKATLPSDHPGRKVLIFQLFDRVQEENIPQDQWNDWIKQQIEI